MASNDTHDIKQVPPQKQAGQKKSALHCRLGIMEDMQPLILQHAPQGPSTIALPASGQQTWHMIPSHFCSLVWRKV